MKCKWAFLKFIWAEIAIQFVPNLEFGLLTNGMC
jgi:hypothetical protein